MCLQNCCWQAHKSTLQKHIALYSSPTQTVKQKTPELTKRSIACSPSWSKRMASVCYGLQLPLAAHSATPPANSWVAMPTTSIMQYELQLSMQKKTKVTEFTKCHVAFRFQHFCRNMCTIEASALYQITEHCWGEAAVKLKRSNRYCIAML